MRGFTVALALFVSEAYATIHAKDIAGCKAFAKTFDNTCPKDGSGNGTVIANVESWSESS